MGNKVVRGRSPNLFLEHSKKTECTVPGIRFKAPVVRLSQKKRADLRQPFGKDHVWVVVTDQRSLSRIHLAHEKTATEAAVICVFRYLSRSAKRPVTWHSP